MDLEIIILSEGSQTQKNKYDIAYIQNLKKMLQMTLFINTKKKENQRLRKQTCGYYQRGKEWGEG